MNTRLSLSLAALVLMAAPATALTLEQAQAELAGMSCSGSSCTSSTSSTTTNQLPDVVSSYQIETAPATSEAASQPTRDGSRGFWNERCKTFAYVNADCTVLSIAPTSGGSPAQYKTVLVVTPGGIETVVTCTTTTKTLSYNGPHTSRDKAWSVDSSESTSNGAC